MSANLDMTAMYVMHDALRRELEQLARVTARTDDDPRRVLAAAAGWELFKKALHVHHTAEDDALWPVMRETLAGRPDDLALLDAMEAEHAAIGPILDAIDVTLADRETGPEWLGDLVDSLVTGLTGHLKHEEDEGLPLIDATVTLEQWQNFGQAHAARMGPDTPRILPWMLDGANPEAVQKLLAQLPEPARLAFEAQWRPAYAALDLWGTRTTA